ncbi:MAG: phenylacetate--CoA ligase, partial [Methylacidiphilales bacterium]|nr:phenylacetate--CoA ligase [Candidatus Methylacidiphilales bacterium]
KQISLIQDFNVTGVHITPSYALHVADILRNELKMDPKDLGLKYLVYGAEPSSAATREKLESIYGAVAYNCYGLSEMNGPGVGFDCPEKIGLHIWEDNYLMEVVDRETGQREKIPAM